MIIRKSKEEIKRIRHAGYIVALVHQEMKRLIEPGISAKELDNVAFDIIKKNKAVPTFLGYHGFPASICASLNEQVVHGFPLESVILKEGDIISVDVGATYGGLVGDSAWTYPVGKISSEKERLLKATEEALFAAISQMFHGNILDNVGGAIEDIAKREKLGIVRQYGGHGVGRSMHEEPFVFNYRTCDKTVLKSGMTIAIEPMLNLGGDAVEVLADKWTVQTVDKMPSAHFEHSILVTDDKPVILTTL
ncbi:MAG TPA: type I methionyl aminopeptidase [Candidatus Gastranaerophilaceae bacterium]|nr:type I methionyl aminopeptidase [Candidatus Gastranaerophilaceae bacterium]HPT42013.1 type I methionyl aminopeptidase [Candidatus Gastranaerophilaceae bacterium]